MVLTSIPAYFLTVFILKKWAAKRIDKLHCSFLWRGAVKANGGHCLVRWAKVLKPKKFGGLGVLDLDMFSMALRLRWLWYEWAEEDRSWVGTEPPVNEVDRHFFRISTVVIIGNGLNAEFWNSSWLQGTTPRDIARSLYRLAWRKHRKVFEEISNHNWTRGLRRMNSVEEMAKFVIPWDLVQEVQFTDHPDVLQWRWTATSEYTSKSAYRVQLHGSYCTFDVDGIWKAHAESKHKFFAWLMVQCKLLTADKLAARNWPCSPICPLCRVSLESAEHICLHYPFAQQVWYRIAAWTEGLVQFLVQGESMELWWSEALGSC
jgi:hypothetical protein